LEQPNRDRKVKALMMGDEPSNEPGQPTGRGRGMGYSMTKQRREGEANGRKGKDRTEQAEQVQAGRSSSDWRIRRSSDCRRGTINRAEPRPVALPRPETPDSEPGTGRIARRRQTEPATVSEGAAPLGCCFNRIGYVAKAKMWRRGQKGGIHWVSGFPTPHFISTAGIVTDAFGRTGSARSNTHCTLP